MDMTQFAEEVTAQLNRIQTEGLKRLTERDGRIVALEKQIHDLATGGRAGFQGGSLRDVLMAEKTLIDRPVPFDRGQTHKIAIAAKDIIGVSRGYPEQTTIVAGGPRIPLGVQNLIPSDTTTSGAISYLEESSFTNNAAAVLEGTAKPQSEKVFTPRTKPIEVIAHYFRLSRQSWEDLPQVAGQIESNGIYGLALKVDQQLLKGTGTAPQLGPGLYVAATAAAAVPANTNLIDRLFLAAAELTAAGWIVDGCVLNALDYAGMVLLKDSTGAYIYSNSVPLPRLVTSPALAVGEFLVGAFTQAHIFMRSDANVTVATQNEDDFIKNKLVALCETRLALAVYQPGAFRKNGTVGTLEAQSAEPPPPPPPAPPTRETRAKS